MKQVLATGIIRAPHGVKGYVKVHSYSGEYEHFFNLKTVTVERQGRSRELSIEDIQKFNNEILMKFRGIDSPEDAKFLSGWDILVPRNQACKLDENCVYTADLIGMKLLYDTEEVGTVLSVTDGPQSYLMEVECNDSKKRIVPYFVGVFVEAADLNTNTIKLLKKELVE